MIGKFNSLRHQVVYRASLDGFDEGFGDIQTYGLYHHFVKDLYGKHYIVTEDSVGFVDVECFDTTFTDHNGDVWASAEAGNRWLELSDAYDAWNAQFDEEDDETLD